MALATGAAIAMLPYGCVLELKPWARALLFIVDAMCTMRGNTSRRIEGAIVRFVVRHGLKHSTHASRAMPARASR